MKRRVRISRAIGFKRPPYGYKVKTLGLKYVVMKRGEKPDVPIWQTISKGVNLYTRFEAVRFARNHRDALEGQQVMEFKA